MKKLIVVLACALLAACTTTSQRAFDKSLAKPAAGAKVLLVRPDVSLKLLTASGLEEPRPEWSDAARTNLSDSVRAHTGGHGLQLRELDPANAQDGKIGQLLRLHSLVGQSILLYDNPAMLPAKKGAFDWTLGDGAQTLGQTYDADYALFVYANGSYSSSGRVGMMIGMAMLGVSIPTGSQTAFMSLVDLKTGRVVWFGTALAAPDTDMRDATGAQKLVAAMMKTAPL